MKSLPKYPSEILGVKGSIINCTWKQSAPFNQECYTSGGQRALAGCVPVAVGQIMYYWGKNYTYDNYYYDWSELHNVHNASSCPTDTVAWSGVQHLLATLGEPDNLDANYGTTQTSASQYNTPRTFENFGFYSGGSIETYSAAGVLSSVSDGPILVVGYSHRTVLEDEQGNVLWLYNYANGHAWVLDKTIEVSEFDHLHGIPALRVYCHCNWGWGGYHNGYFLTGVFNSNNPLPEPTGGILTLSAGQDRTKSQVVEEGTDYFYQYSLQMNRGIRGYLILN